MALLVGAFLAIAVCALATVIGLDRDRAFYPTVTIVIASYYALFAVMGASTDALVIESLVGAAFLAVAVSGFRSSLWVVVAALVAHGVFDLVHGSVISNPGVPSWWPEFCLTYDVTAGGYLAWLLKSGRIGAATELCAQRDRRGRCFIKPTRPRGRRLSASLGTDMVLALMIVGVALLGMSVWAWRRNRLLVVTDMPPVWRTLWRFRWIVGLALGCACYFVRYRLEGGDGIYTVYGVPFMSYAIDQRGFDYVGPLTMPAIVLNFITWTCLPQLLLWLLSRWPRKSTGGASA